MVVVVIIGVVALIVGFGAFFGAPYLPSQRRELNGLFTHLYTLGSTDVVLDIGSGDGVVLREVSRRGATAIGVEINPFFIVLSKLLSHGDPKVQVVAANSWRYRFPSDITLVYAFSVGRDGARLERKVQNEANRMGKPLVLVCLGNPLPTVTATATYRAYARYDFYPLHPSKAQV